MKDNTILEFGDPARISADPLTDILRKSAQDLLAQAVEVEVCDLMAKHTHLADAAGRHRLARHGHLPEREVMTGIGLVSVKVPRVRDQDTSEVIFLSYLQATLNSLKNKNTTLGK